MIKKVIKQSLKNDQREVVINIAKDNEASRVVLTISEADLNELKQPRMRKAGRSFDRAEQRTKGGEKMAWGLDGHRRGRKAQQTEGEETKQEDTVFGKYRNRSYNRPKKERKQKEDREPRERNLWIRRFRPNLAIPTMAKSQYQETFEGRAGETIQAELTFKNCSKQPYTEGYHFESVLDENAKLAVESIKLEIPQTGPYETFTVKVPIKILNTAAGQELTVPVGVTNAEGREIGFAVPLKVKVAGDEKAEEKVNK